MCVLTGIESAHVAPCVQVLSPTQIHVIGLVQHYIALVQSIVGDDAEEDVHEPLQAENVLMAKWQRFSQQMHDMTLHGLPNPVRHGSSAFGLALLLDAGLRHVTYGGASGRTIEDWGRRWDPDSCFGLYHWFIWQRLLTMWQTDFVAKRTRVDDPSLWARVQSVWTCALPEWIESLAQVLPAACSIRLRMQRWAQCVRLGRTYFAYIAPWEATMDMWMPRWLEGGWIIQSHGDVFCYLRPCPHDSPETAGCDDGVDVGHAIVESGPVCSSALPLLLHPTGIQSAAMPRLLSSGVDVP